MTLSFDLSPELALSLFAVDAGSEFPLEAKAAQVQSAGGVRTVLALDEKGRRLWLLESGGGDELHPPLADAKLAGMLRRIGAARATVLPKSGPRLLPGEIDGLRTRALVDSRTRATLGAAVRGPRLAGSEGERLQRLRPLVSAASNLQQETSGPGGLLDGRVGQDGSLNHFWAAAPAEGGRMPWVELRLPEPAMVRAMDIVHAQSCGFSPSFDLKGYRLLARRSTADRWQVVTDVRHESPVPRERVEMPRGMGPVEWLRLEVLDPAHQAGCRTARVGELVLWGAPAGGE